MQICVKTCNYHIYFPLIPSCTIEVGYERKYQPPITAQTEILLRSCDIKQVHILTSVTFLLFSSA